MSSGYYFTGILIKKINCYFVTFFSDNMNTNVISDNMNTNVRLFRVNCTISNSETSYMTGLPSGPMQFRNLQKKSSKYINFSRHLERLEIDSILSRI